MGLVGDGDGDGDGWVWLEMEMEMEMAGFGWRGLGFSGFGWGGDRWSGWSFLLKKAGFFCVWSRWVEIGGWGGRFCCRGLGFSRFG